MAADIFTLVSGSYTNEQDLVTELDEFLPTIGWQKLETFVDNANDKAIAYYTDGNDSNFDRSFFIFRGRNNRLEFSTASNYNVTTHTASDEIGGSTDHSISTSTSSGIYWFIANEDAVHVLIKNSSAQTLHGGSGRFKTYYSSFYDPKPTYIFGQGSPGETFTGTRLTAYGPRSWGPYTSASGAPINYVAAHPTEVANGVYNPRDNQPKALEPVFYSSAFSLDYEVRGEVPGLYMCGGAGYDYGNIVTITGAFGFPEGKYFINKTTDATTWFIGPTTSG